MHDFSSFPPDSYGYAPLAPSGLAETHQKIEVLRLSLCMKCVFVDIVSNGGRVHLGTLEKDRQNMRSMLEALQEGMVSFFICQSAFV